MQVLAVLIAKHTDANARVMMVSQYYFVGNLIKLGPLLTHTASTPTEKANKRKGLFKR